jgi:hypothetical protein
MEIGRTATSVSRFPNLFVIWGCLWIWPEHTTIKGIFEYVWNHASGSRPDSHNGPHFVLNAGKRCLDAEQLLECHTLCSCHTRYLFANSPITWDHMHRGLCVLQGHTKLQRFGRRPGVDILVFPKANLRIDYNKTHTIPYFHASRA